MQRSSFLEVIAVLSFVFLFSGTSATYQLVNTIDNYAVAEPLTEFNNLETLKSWTLTEIAPDRRSVIINGIHPIDASISNGELSFANNIQQVYAKYETIDETPLAAFANINGATAFAIEATLATPSKFTVTIYCPTGAITEILTIPSPSAGQVLYNIPFADFGVLYGTCPVETLFSIVIYVNPIVGGELVSGTFHKIGTSKEVILPPLPVTLATAGQLNIPSNGNQILSINNVYDVSSYNPETPSDACFVGTSNPFWYYVEPSDIERTITISTCETIVDTVVGVFLADGTLLGCNDDRDSSLNSCSNPSSFDCNSLSSFVEFTNGVNTGFYVVVAGLAPTETGDIDLVIQSHVQTEDLIEESTTLIIDSLTQQVTQLSSDLTSQIAGVNTNVDNTRDTIGSAITALSGSVDGQFQQVANDLSGVQTAIQNGVQASTDSLSSQITNLSQLLGGNPAALDGITNTVNTISNNVNQLSTDLGNLSGNVGAVNTLVQGVSDNLGTLAGNLADLDGDVQQVSLALASQTSAITNLQSSLTTGLSGVNSNIDSVSSEVSTGFGAVSDSFTALNGVTQTIINDVAAGNAVGNNIYDFIRSAYFENFLLATTSGIDSIPWRWRTPAAANGSMDDILVYLTNLYNAKLAACNQVTTTACNAFRQNATPAFLNLNSSYNTQVNTNKYKKAFQVLQTFYTKLFPTTLWV